MHRCDLLRVQTCKAVVLCRRETKRSKRMTAADMQGWRQRIGECFGFDATARASTDPVRFVTGMCLPCQSLNGDRCLDLLGKLQDRAVYPGATAPLPPDITHRLGSPSAVLISRLRVVIINRLYESARAFLNVHSIKATIAHMLPQAEIEEVVLEVQRLACALLAWSQLLVLHHRTVCERVDERMSHMSALHIGLYRTSCI